MKGAASFLTAAVLSVFGGGATTTPAVVDRLCIDITRSLAYGSKGTDVAALQSFLKVESTGYFGPLTQKKLIEWQIAKKIIVSAKTAGAGTTGPKTRAAMKCTVTTAIGAVPAAKSKAATTVAATTSTSTIPNLPAFAPASSGGGGGGVVAPSVSPYGYTCAAPGDKPAASSCTTGSWQLSADEAGCIIWACMDADDRG